MILKDILAISGEQGLFRFIAQGKNAIIIEHLETGKRSSAFSSAKVSSLEEISVFTEEEDLPLGKVFDKIFEKEGNGPSIDPKSDPEKLKEYFGEIIPDYSREKVYVSDIRKIVLWYNILRKKNMLIKEEPEKKEDAKKDKTGKKAVAASEAPAPVRKKKKSAAGTKEQK
jgi:hypothetical protein